MNTSPPPGRLCISSYLKNVQDKEYQTAGKVYFRHSRVILGKALFWVILFAHCQQLFEIGFLIFFAIHHKGIRANLDLIVDLSLLTKSLLSSMHWSTKLNHFHGFFRKYFYQKNRCLCFGSLQFFHALIGRFCEPNWWCLKNI